MLFLQSQIQSSAGFPVHQATAGLSLVCSGGLSSFTPALIPDDLLWEVGPVQYHVLRHINALLVAQPAEILKWVIYLPEDNLPGSHHIGRLP